MPLHMRLPKLKGFKNPFKTEYQVVNLDKLAALYPEGGEVTVEPIWSPRVPFARTASSRSSARARSPWRCR